jgi:hypothetical protein
VTARGPGKPVALRRAAGDFLALPAIVVTGFLALAVVARWLDGVHSEPVRGVRGWLREHLLGHMGTVEQLLGTLAGGLLTVTSITFSVLLIAVQQSAASLTQAVLDQFLRRRLNQLLFGFFAGLSLFTLSALANARAARQPVFGPSLALVLGAVAVLLLVLLVYTTVAQMRVEVIVRSIHDHALAAYDHQLALLRSTPPAPASPHPVAAVIAAERDGFLADLRLQPLRGPLRRAPDVEVELCAPVGAHLDRGDALAVLRAPPHVDTGEVEAAVGRAARLDLVRNIRRDPADAVQELVNIAWTTGSTSKQNREPALLVVAALRDLLVRWAAEPTRGDQPLPAVLPGDVLQEVFDGLEELALVSSRQEHDDRRGDPQDHHGQPRRHDRPREPPAHRTTSAQAFSQGRAEGLARSRAHPHPQRSRQLGGEHRIVATRTPVGPTAASRWPSGDRASSPRRRRRRRGGR